MIYNSKNYEMNIICKKENEQKVINFMNNWFINIIGGLSCYELKYKTNDEKKLTKNFLFKWVEEEFDFEDEANKFKELKELCLYIYCSEYEDNENNYFFWEVEE